jgi:hypothetical protein
LVVLVILVSWWFGRLPLFERAQFVDRPRAEFRGRRLAEAFEGHEEPFDFFAKLSVGRTTTTGVFTTKTRRHKEQRLFIFVFAARAVFLRVLVP